MLTTLKALVWSYLLLCFASFVCLASPALQRLCVFGWAVTVVWIAMRARQRGNGIACFIAAAGLLELPGGSLSLVSAWYAASGLSSEWPGGLMEFWYHPFMSLLELLPAVTIGNWSTAYLATCLIPLGVTAFCASAWLLTRRIVPAADRF